MQTTFLLAGALFGIGLAALSEVIVNVLFGSAYGDLVSLLPLFGLLFFVRFAAAAWGVVLTAAGEQSYRTFASGIHWLLIASIAPILVPRMGISGWLLSLIVGSTLLGILYAVRSVRRLESSWTTVWMTILSCLGFVPFLNAYF